MTDLVRAGELLAQSGMFGISNAGAGFVVAATCHQQGISLMEFQRTYHIVNGKPSMRADAMLAELRKRGGKHRIIDNTVNRAAIEIEFEGQKLKFEFTIEDARRTGDCFEKDGKTLKHTWAKRPDDMLWARCVSRAVRRICPEIVSGLYTPEEVADFDTPTQRREPVRINPDEVKVRTEQKTVTVDAEPVQEAEINYQICPAIGSDFDGVEWSELDTATLQGALEAEIPEVVENHKDVIRGILAEREGSNQ